jgi:multimeric flavodoxin WrbA
VHTFDSINHFFTINEMIVPGANYWNIGFGRGEGEVQGDDEGLATMKTLAENMFWLLQKLD